MCDLFNSKRNIGCDVLIVADERDTINRHVTGIRRELGTIKHPPRVKGCTVFDYAREMNSIRCKKVVFLLSQHTRSLETMVSVWLDALGIDKQAPMRYLVVNHDDTLVNDENGTPVRMEGDHVIHVATLDNGHLWWPRLLLFFYGRSKKTLDQGVTCFLRNAAENGEYSTQLFADIESGFNQMNIRVSEAVSKRQCCVLVSDRGNDTEVTLDEDVRSAIRKARGKRCRVHTISATGMAIPPRLGWLTDWAHRSTQTLRFWLWLMIDLDMLTVEIKNRRTMKPHPPAQFELREATRGITIRWDDDLISTDEIGDESNRFVFIEMRTGAEPWTLVKKVSMDQRSYTFTDVCVDHKYYFRAKVKSEKGDSCYTNPALMAVLYRRNLLRVVYAVVFAGMICPPLLAYLLTPMCWFDLYRYQNTGRKGGVLITGIVWSVVVYIVMLALLIYFCSATAGIAAILLPGLICCILSTVAGSCLLLRKLNEFMTLRAQNAVI